MDPFTALVLAIVMIAVTTVIQVVTWPFRKAKEAAVAHPRRVAQMVLSAIAAGLFAYLLKAPFVIEISFAGGVAGLILGEILS